MKQILLPLMLLLLFLTPCFAQENIFCPDIKVVSRDKTYLPGSPMTFLVSPVEELKNLKLEYNWKTSEGFIESGQGTPALIVATVGLHNLTITVTVEIKGLPQNCPNSFSGSAIVEKPPGTTTVSDGPISGHATPEELKRQFSHFYTELKNQPTARGIIIIYGTNKEIAKRKAEIKRIIKTNKYNIKRIEYISSIKNAGKFNFRMELYVVPKGGKNPVPIP
jgi:hypothetical protein